MPLPPIRKPSRSMTPWAPVTHSPSIFRRRLVARVETGHARGVENARFQRDAIDGASDFAERQVVGLAPLRRLVVEADLIGDFHCSLSRHHAQAVLAGFEPRLPAQTRGREVLAVALPRTARYTVEEKLRR